MIKFIFNVETDHRERSTASGLRQNKIVLFGCKMVKEYEFVCQDYREEFQPRFDGTF